MEEMKEKKTREVKRVLVMEFLRRGRMGGLYRGEL